MKELDKKSNNLLSSCSAFADLSAKALLENYFHIKL